VGFSIEAKSLDDAQRAAGLAEAAAFDALGEAVRREDESGPLSRTTLEPVDRGAFDAFAAEDLGPGISSGRFTAQPPPDPT
jgi:hypothetical protein